MSTRTVQAPQSVDTDLAHLRLPPQSIEAEQSVLGGLLLDNSAWDRAGDLLTKADFYRHDHRLIFAVIGGSIAANKPADVITVFERLQALGKAEECGGIAYLNALAQSMPSAANLRRYAEIVREHSIKRQIIAACDEVATLAFGSADADAALDRATSIFGQLERTGQRVAPMSIERLLDTALGRYSDLAEGKVTPALPTGIAPLDRLLNGGLRPGKVYGLAARPSIGKSAASRHIGLHTAMRDAPTLLLSQEMPVDEVTDCVVAQVSGIDSERLQTGKLEDGEWTRLAQAADRVRPWPFFVDDQGGLRLADIRAKARAIKGLKVLILDYLQLSSSTLKNASTNDQIAEISKGLKALAMELSISVVVLSQLNRDVEKRADREPQLSDLRDSGAIEQDLDVAVMLWTVREDVDGTRIVGWKVAKHRGGGKGRFGMRFDAPRYRWHESTESIDRAQTGSGSSKGSDL
jgi:replicative DNA helicase